jgi:hypothetical protein
LKRHHQHGCTDTSRRLIHFCLHDAERRALIQKTTRPVDSHILLAGLYHAVSFMVNACGIELESQAPRFPSAALRP